MQNLKTLLITAIEYQVAQPVKELLRAGIQTVLISDLVTRTIETNVIIRYNIQYNLIARV